jgi:hypothetical protein
MWERNYSAACTRYNADIANIAVSADNGLARSNPPMSALLALLAMPALISLAPACPDNKLT